MLSPMFKLNMDTLDEICGTGEILISENRTSTILFMKHTVTVFLESFKSRVGSL